MTSILKISNLEKSYTSGSKKLTVLEDINFSITKNETFSIVGPSGSGKTTLLGICAGLDKPDSGTVTLNGIVMNSLSEDERAALRNEHVGFVFQDFQLLATLTAIENVAIPLELRGAKNAMDCAKGLLEKVGLGNRGNHYPSQLSGGEQQRVALARAFANEPKILFADEPTGNLDAETGERVVELLFELNKELGTTLVLVTHDMELAKKTQNILTIKGGKIASLTRSTHV